MVNLIDSTYVKIDLEQVAANATQLYSEEITQLLGLLNYFEELFGVTLWYWYTDPVDLELKPYYKQFNCKYYPVPRINRDTFHKDLDLLVKIWVLNLVH